MRNRKVTLKELLEIVLVGGVHVEYIEQDTDSHSWQYHYVQSICLELARENPERAKEIFETLKLQAQANLRVLMMKGDGSNGLLLNEIARLANLKYRAIDKAMHYAPALGDNSRDRDIDEYDGTMIDELSLIRESESTLRSKYLDDNNVTAQNRKNPVIEIAFGLTCTRAEMARGKKRNGTGSKGNKDLHTGFIWQLNN